MVEDTSTGADTNPPDLHSIKPWIPSIIIAISIILGLTLVWPLFGQGIPMNIDLPFHYGRVLCYANNEMWSLPTAWCTHGQAGIATFQGYAVIPFHLVSILDWFFDTLPAFKIMLVLILFSLPFAGWYLLHSLGKPLAGALAFAFLLLEHGGWHSGGFEKIFYVGLFSNALGSAMLILSLALAIQFFRAPTPLRLASTSVVSALFFLSHAATFMFFPIPLLILAFIYRAHVTQHWKWFILYPLLVFLLVAYWFVPFLSKMDYYVSAGGGTVKTHEIWQYFWQPLHAWLAFLGIAGILFMILNKKTEYRAIALTAAAIPLLWIIGFVWDTFPYFSFIQMIRNLAELRSFLLIGAAVLLGYLSEINMRFSLRAAPKAKPWLLIPCLLIAGVIAYQLYGVTARSSTMIILSSQGNIPMLEPVYRAVEDASGRIMVEDTLFNFGNTPLSLSHPWSASPAFSRKEFIGTGDNLYNKNDFSNTQVGVLLNSSINDWSDPALLEFLDLLNIQYVVVYTPTYFARFARIPGITLHSNATLPWIILKTPYTPSWFSLVDPASGQPTTAVIESSSYQGTWATVSYSAASPFLLRFKARHWPNWKATIDGKPLPLHRGKMGLMESPVPEGKHTVTYSYRMIWIDWAGYLLTIIGIGVLVWLWKFSTR